MMMDLPNDIVIKILAELNFHGYQKLRDAHPAFSAYLDQSPTLQYKFAAEVAGVIDNPHSAMTLSERIALLLDREAAWPDLHVDFVKEIHAPNDNLGRYILNSDILVFENMTHIALHHVTLPSVETDVPTWSTIQMDPSLTIVGKGFSVTENNLAAIITQREAPDYPNHRLTEIHFLQLSTGEPHPLAHSSVIVLERSLFPVSGRAEIADHIVAITTETEDGSGRFYVVDWKKSLTKLNVAISEGYDYCSSITFITPSMLVLPNNLNATLDICLIPTSENASTSMPVVLSLALPTLAEDFDISSFWCCAKPDLTPSGTPYSSRPFHASTAASIMVFRTAAISAIRGIYIGPTMLVHRSVLVDVCNTYIERAAREGLGCLRVDWEAWGPDVTRWLPTPNRPSIMNASDQRCSRTLFDAQGNEAQEITIFDFNPLHIPESSVGSQEVIEYEEQRKGVFICNTTTFLHDAAFKVPVKSRLPYIATTHYLTPDMQDYEWIIDEERLIGIKAGIFLFPNLVMFCLIVMSSTQHLSTDNGVQTEIKICHIGTSLNRNFAGPVTGRIRCESRSNIAVL
ncbi:hypothetical protein H0H87_010602 [Tephrocybe sp. NHM501043]|nr:hypothetical protein H0H87_010602 [Tephrocybe sp. NHM501043]